MSQRTTTATSAPNWALRGRWIASVCAFWAQTAGADEPRLATEPRLLSETGEVTSVADAFDGEDPFDAHVTLGFQQTWKSANIRRETTLFAPGLSTGGFVPRTENIALFSQSVSTLNVGVEAGIYKDLSLTLKLPIIVADSRELKDKDGSSANPQRYSDSTGDPLFSLPFKSPTRSGIDWFSAALNWAIFNQRRDPTKPTWVLGVEGRFGVGPRLRACNDGGAVRCPDPSDPLTDRGDPGISRGMTTAILRSTFSRRFGYLEPYTGVALQAEFPTGNGEFSSGTDLQGSLLNLPPVLGSFTMGVEFVPYENRESFQRLVADLRFTTTYQSPGRDYTELFDALGSSSARTLRSPNPGGYTLGPDGSTSVADPQAPNVFFSGITAQQAYGSITTSAQITWQAGQYVKFVAGFGHTFAQSHLITGADACNPDFKGEPAKAGPCRAVIDGDAGSQQITGIPNPHHRQSIDVPGRRFSADDTTYINFWLNGVVMF